MNEVWGGKWGVTHVPGDSGSGLMDGQGRAVGALVTRINAPLPGANSVTALSYALDFPRHRTGWVLEVLTWGLIDPGLFPAPVG